MCDQQSLRSICTYAQSDQSLCKWLEYSMTVRLLTEHHLEFLSFKRGCTGSYESTLVKMPHCWKSHAMAQFEGINFFYYFNIHLSQKIKGGYANGRHLVYQVNNPILDVTIAVIVPCRVVHKYIQIYTRNQK